MRKLITTMACLSIALLPNIACSDVDNQELSKEELSLHKNNSNENSNLASRAATETEIDYFSNSSVNLITEITNNESLLDAIRNPTVNSDGSIQYINQNNLDYMLNFINYENDVNLSMVNGVVGEIIRANNLGFEQHINDMNLSDNAKSIALKMLQQNRTYQTPSEYPEFEKLLTSEKDMLNNSYAMATNLNSRISEDLGWGIFWGSIIIGVGYGSLFPGAGWIIGGVVGAVVGIVLNIVLKD